MIAERVWQGEVREGGKTYSAVVNLQKTAMTIAYPELGCKGTVTIQKSLQKSVWLEETLEPGRCGRGGLVTLIPAGEDLVNFEWRSNRRSSVCCRGLLAAK